MSAVPMLTVNAPRVSTFFVVRCVALMHIVIWLESLMPPQAAFIASAVPSSL